MDKVNSIRGAVTVKKNNVKEIKNATTLLLSELFKQNELDESKIINIIFTVTDDLDSMNPAMITREKFKLGSTAMLCVQEMKVKGSLSKCIRVLIQTYTKLPKGKIKHIYLGKAESLRPDLSFDV